MFEQERKQEMDMGRLSTVYSIWRAGHQSLEKISLLQKRRLEGLLHFTINNSPFYQRLYQDLRPEQISDIQSIPPITKRQLMASFDDWVTDPEITRSKADSFVADKSKIGEKFLGKYFLFTTSGTTGVPGIFIHDDDSWFLLGVLARIRGLPNWVDPGMLKDIITKRGLRTATLVATGGHFAGAAGVKLLINEHPILDRFYRIFSVMDPLPKTVAELNVYNPTVLFGYPTAIEMLAAEQEAGHLKINPSLALAAGEFLPPKGEERIARTFSCKVRQIYGASEFPYIALECAEGRYHINSDWVIVEPVDENYQPVEPGKPSHTVLLTNLVNRVQPIIRYDLGDSITMYSSSEPCPCGKNFPSMKVEGRTNDILKLINARGERISIPPLAITTEVEEVPGVHRFQVIQTQSSALALRLEIDPEFEQEAVWSNVIYSLNEYLTLHNLPNIQLQKTDERPHRDPKSGKFRQVWSEVK